MPRVSVIIPTYNSAPYLFELFQSLRAQTFQDFELILVDDCSQDETLDLLQGYSREFPSFTLLKNEHRLGIAQTCNRGAEQTKGDYLVRHDADDVSHPDRLLRQVNTLDRDTSLVAVTSFYHLINDRGEHLAYHRHPSVQSVLLWHCLFSNPLGAQSQVMMRRSALPHPLYKVSVPFAEDYLLWWELLTQGKFEVIREPLFYYRIHKENASTTHNAEQESSVKSVSLACMQMLIPQLSADDAARLRMIWCNGDAPSAHERRLLLRLERALESAYVPSAQGRAQVRRHYASVMLQKLQRHPRGSWEFSASRLASALVVAQEQVAVGIGRTIRTSLRTRLSFDG